MKKFDRVIAWIVAESKQEGVDALEKMLNDMKECDDDVTQINMHILKEELVEEDEAE